MDYICVVPVCSESVYEKVFFDVSKRHNQQYRTFLIPLLEGLAACGESIEVLCSFAVNSDINPAKVLDYEDDIDNDVHYYYLKTYNIRIVGRIVKFLQTFLSIIKKAKRGKSIVFADPNCTTSCIAATMAAKLKRCGLLYIYTDLPTIHTSSVGQRLTIRQKMASNLAHSAQMNILTTEAMAGVLRLKKDSFVVVEGIVNTIHSEKNRTHNHTGKRVIMYTGGLVKHYGLDRLIEAFLMASVDDVELHIYGGGPYEKEINELSDRYSSIKYFGIKPHSDIVELQKEATLLVNPRPSDQEYTKYSFPIKTMEYIASGVPVLTTHLPGIPKDYDEHVYYFEDETVEGMAKRINELLSMDSAVLHNKGVAARQWLLENKNAVSMCHKIIRFVQEVEGSTDADK